MNRQKRPASLLLALVTVLTLSPPAYAAKTATTIQLQKTEGTVTAANSAGRSLTLRENMQFYNGYSVDTSAKSYAWLNLDSSKLAKVDAVSKVEFRKKNKDLELLVSSGNIFFNVTEPLENDETMKVETSTFIAGIRGTCGWIECDSASTTLNLLEGSVECQVQGQSQPVRVEAGQSVTFSTPSKSTAAKSMTTDDIPGMVLVEVVDDTALCGKIQADSGLDLAAISMAEAQRRLAEEEAAVAQAESAAETAAAQNPTPAPAPAPEPEPVAADPISAILGGDFSPVAGAYAPLSGQGPLTTLTLNANGSFSGGSGGYITLAGAGRTPASISQASGGYIECVLSRSGMYEETYYVFPSGIPSSFYGYDYAVAAGGGAAIQSRPCIVYHTVDGGVMDYYFVKNN